MNRLKKNVCKRELIKNKILSSIGQKTLNFNFSYILNINLKIINKKIN
jgi:hypothetical protein